MKALAIILVLAVGISFSQWSSDPGVNLPVSSGTNECTTPHVVLGINGDTYVSWADGSGSSGYDMRLQRFDLLGNPQWGTGGVVVFDSFTGGTIMPYGLSVDNSGNALLAFTVQAGTQFRVYASKVSAAGDLLWGAGGILMSDTTIAGSISSFGQIVGTSSGDAVCSWSYIPAPDTAWTVMQRISPTGSLLWGDGITVESDTAGIYCWEGVLSPRSDDDVILVYTTSEASGWNKQLYAQRYDASGSTVWPAPAVLSNTEEILQQCIQPPAYPDGSDGFYITWEETGAGGLVTSLVQHVTSGGAVAMADGGVPVSTTAGRNHGEPFLAASADGEDVFVFWREMNDLETLEGLYGQRMDSGGNRLWTDGGMAFIDLQSADGYGYISVQTYGDSAAVFYLEGATPAADTAYCMLVDSAGAYLWSGDRIELSTAGCSRGYFQSTPLCWGQQWITVWSDDRGAAEAVYAQNVKLDGTLGTAGLGVSGGVISRGVVLGSVSPNPFSSTGSVSFSLASSGFVTLGLFDLTGRAVSLVADGFYPAGNHTVAVPAGSLASGVYILRLESSGEVSSRKCMLLV